MNGDMYATLRSTEASRLFTVVTVAPYQTFMQWLSRDTMADLVAHMIVASLNGIMHRPDRRRAHVGRIPRAILARGEAAIYLRYRGRERVAEYLHYRIVVLHRAKRARRERADCEGDVLR
jgi:hypothetical protein